MRSGRVGLVILAAGIAPALIKRSKSLSRYVGDQLIRAGEYLRHGTDQKPPAAKDGVNDTQTTKSGKGSKDTPIESAAPYTHDEIASQMAAEAMGDGAAAEPPKPKPKPNKKKTHPKTQPQNPKGKK